MRLSFVELSGFRGFRDRIRFDLPSGFAVLTGRNGVGKSTLFDAVDFAITGTLSKYSVKSARGGGLAEHIWSIGKENASDHYVRLGFTDDVNPEFVLTRTRETGLDRSPHEIQQYICSAPDVVTDFENTLMHTTLLRDETIASLSLDLGEQARASAVRSAFGASETSRAIQRTRDILEAARIQREGAQERLRASQDELGRALSALTEARSAEGRESDVVEALSVITSLEPDLSRDDPNLSEVLRGRILNRKLAIVEAQRVLVLIENVEADQTYFTGEGSDKIQELQVTVSRLEKSLRSRTNRQARLIRKSLREEASDQFASHLSAIIEHGAALGLQEGHCPLCDAVRTDKDFRAAIEKARELLASRAELIDKARADVERVDQDIGTTSRDLGQAKTELDALVARRDDAVASFNRYMERLARFLEADSAMNLGELRNALLRKQEDVSRLESAGLLLASSALSDKVATAAQNVERIRERIDSEAAVLSGYERGYELARQMQSAAGNVAREILEEQFDTLMPLIKELYRRLRPHAEWQEIDSDFGGKVRSSLNFTVGNGYNPQFLFSSGQRRAAGIAYLLALHLSRPWCRWDSLLLDDPIQHIDDYRALNLVEVLSAIRRTGKQIIIAVEDEALAEVLCRRLRATNSSTGRLFNLTTSNDGVPMIRDVHDVLPLPNGVLRAAS